MGIKKPAHKRWAGFFRLLNADFIISVLGRVLNSIDVYLNGLNFAKLRQIAG